MHSDKSLTPHSLKPLWFTEPVAEINQQMIVQATAHQNDLTKPAGSLGQLEDVAISFAGWQGVLKPSLEQVMVTIFAGDHGVCDQGVSAFPQEVTSQMVMNFLSGGAAISVLSQHLQAQFSVVDVGVAHAVPEAFDSHPQFDQQNIARGTQDFSLQAAMTEQQLGQALAVGATKIINACMNNSRPDIFIGGEMGIGNTTAASTIYAALLSLSAEQVVGMGTGVDAAGLQRKQQVVNAALNLHQAEQLDAMELLKAVGGFEIAALVGSYIACAQNSIPVLVDGFICTAAALLAVKLNPGVRAWLLFSHCSAELAHQRALTHLSAKPLLDLGLRLGEGSGAALAVPLIQSALLLHNTMATFSQAGVSDRDS